jgi:hypothetical protein
MTRTIVLCAVLLSGCGGSDSLGPYTEKNGYRVRGENPWCVGNSSAKELFCRYLSEAQCLDQNPIAADRDPQTVMFCASRP